MIFDTLDNHALYERLGENFPAGFKFLLENDLTTLPPGRIDIDGVNLFALVQEYTTRPVGQVVWEAHRKYIDIQYMVSGQERMGFANLGTMQLGEYVPEKDFQPMTGSGNHIDVFAGAFTIFFPQDGHMPGLILNSPEAVRKVVLKLKI